MSLTGLSSRLSALRVAPSPRAAPSGRTAAAHTVVARAGKPGVGVLGKKAGMTQVFTDDGLAVPATVISVADGNIVTAVRTEESAGYSAVQVGYGLVPERKLTKPEAGHLKAAGAPPMRHLVEFKVCLLLLVEGWVAGERRGRRRELSELEGLAAARPPRSCFLCGRRLVGGSTRAARVARAGGARTAARPHPRRSMPPGTGLSLVGVG